ncbi:hypothetical protein [Stutzerimonas stutzeri]|uniref:hypothetical protein n=1 Tax=Stutzerimonas stutzeri TaxID=316 RepID=UPI003D00A80E
MYIHVLIQFLQADLLGKIFKIGIGRQLSDDVGLFLAFSQSLGFLLLRHGHLVSWLVRIARTTGEHGQCSDQ